MSTYFQINKHKKYTQINDFSCVLKTLLGCLCPVALCIEKGMAGHVSNEAMHYNSVKFNQAGAKFPCHMASNRKLTL